MVGLMALFSVIMHENKSHAFPDIRDLLASERMRALDELRRRAYRVSPPEPEPLSFDEEQALFYEAVEEMGLQMCPNCLLFTNREEAVLRGLRIRKRTLDWSCTYDRVQIVSQRFVDVYVAAGLQGLCFQELPDDDDFRRLFVERSVEFDEERMRIRRSRLCDECGQYDEVTGANPTYIKGSPFISDDEFVRTDIEFGFGNFKGPKIICGERCKETIRAAGLRGLFFEPIGE